MGLMERIKRLESQTKQAIINTIEFCGIKISTKNLVDDWVQAVIETSEEQEGQKKWD
jgi:hypothetical protein